MRRYLFIVAAMCSTVGSLSVASPPVRAVAPAAFPAPLAGRIPSDRECFFELRNVQLGIACGRQLIEAMQQHRQISLNEIRNMRM